MLYGGYKLNHISLPTYPFAKERYWIFESDNITKNTKQLISKLHPLIDSNESTLKEQCFKKTFTGEEFYLKDHIVGQNKILPGSAYLEIARASGNFACKNQKVVVIKNVIWLKPIIVDDKGKDIYVSLYPNSDSIAFEVYSEEQEERTVYSEGNLVVSSCSSQSNFNKTPEKINFEAIKSRCTDKLTHSQCYHMFAELELNYGPMFRTIQEIFIGTNESLAVLEVSDTGNCFILHPSNIDGAFQTVLGLMKNDFGTYIPFAVNHIEILKPTTTKCYIHTKLIEHTKFDIIIADTDENVLIKIEGFEVKLLTDKSKTSDAINLNAIYENEDLSEEHKNNSNMSIINSQDSSIITDTAIINNDLTINETNKFALKTENFLKNILSKQTKISISNIKPSEKLENYGIDSIMIMNLTNTLEKHFGKLSKTLFFEYQTLEELTQYFIKNYNDQLTKLINSNITKNSNKNYDNKSKTKDIINFIPKQRQRFLTGSNTDAKKLEMQNQDIAIIGLSGRYPMADNINEFWDNLKNGKDCISEIPKERWDNSQYYDEKRDIPGKTYSKWGGFINDVDKFDALFFNISPREAEITDPQERLFLETVWHTIEDAGYIRKDLDKYKVGVFVGVMYGQYQLFGTQEYQIKDSSIPVSSYASIANRISYFFNFHGPSLALDTMCSSSLTAIHLACESIKRQESTLAIAGGVNITIHPHKYLMLSQSGFTSSDGRCRSFGEGGDGYVPGEGVGAVLLKPLNKAIEDGDHIYAIIKGSSVNHGGKTNGYTVPNPNAQYELILETLKKAEIDPKTINYIEAHGTGTSLGDPIEITGLSKAFGEFTSEKQFCSIGSLKSNIGHLESAAGIAGITKVLLQLKHKKLVPSIHSDILNPNIDFEETPFYVQHKLENWYEQEVNGKKLPRRAGISSFGAGGANAHVVLEEYVNLEVSDKRLEVGKNDANIIVLSAKTENQLKEYAKNIVTFLNQNLEIDISHIAYTLQVGREAFDERIAIIASDINALISILSSYCEGKDNIDNLYTGNIKTYKSKFLTIVNGSDGIEFLKNLIQHEQLVNIAELWVLGVEIPWEILYEGYKPNRVSLPTYLFAGERYWISNSDKISRNNKEFIHKLHPLIDSNESTLQEQCFKKTFTGEEFYLIDHIVAQNKVLPGAAYLEIVTASGNLCM